LQSLVTTNVFLGLQTVHLELPENGQRQAAMLTVRHTYMYIIMGPAIYENRPFARKYDFAG